MGPYPLKAAGELPYWREREASVHPVVQGTWVLKIAAFYNNSAFRHGIWSAGFEEPVDSRAFQNP
jgi:hypothetical protein